MKSYQHRWGGGRRASRVEVAYRPLSHEPVVTEHACADVRGVYVRDGAMAVEGGAEVWLWPGRGERPLRRDRRVLGDPWLATSLAAAGRGVRQLGWAAHGDYRTVLYQSRPTRTWGDGLHVVCLAVGDAPTLGWAWRVEELGVGIVHEDGTVVTLTGLANHRSADREPCRLRRWAPRGDEGVAGPDELSELDAPKLQEERLYGDPMAYDLSAIEGGYVVLSAAEPAFDPEDADLLNPVGPWARHAARVRGEAASTQWSTRVSGLDPAFGASWCAEVDFAVRQPPIDGGGGTVYLAGAAVAAVSNGEVRWQRPLMGWATAFGDGALVVAGERNVTVLGADGVVQQQWELDAPIAGPPAIDEAGSVHVVTPRSVISLEGV